MCRIANKNVQKLYPLKKMGMGEICQVYMFQVPFNLLLQSNKAYLERSMKESEDSLRDLIQSKQQGRG